MVKKMDVPKKDDTSQKAAQISQHSRMHKDSEGVIRNPQSVRSQEQSEHVDESINNYSMSIINSRQPQQSSLFEPGDEVDESHESKEEEVEETPAVEEEEKWSFGMTDE